MNCATGDVLDNEQAQAKRKEDVLDSLSRIARNFRSRMGEARSTVIQHDTPLVDATTSSLEALKAYDAALKIHFSRGARSALPLFRRAAEIDPEFAMAHAWLGRAYANLDQSVLAEESIQRAWQLRDRVNDRERYSITTRYHALVTGNLEEARQSCEAWAQAYPRDPQPYIGLSVYYKGIGQYDKAAAEARRAIEIAPDFGVGYYDLAVNQAYLDRLPEAGDVLRSAIGRGLGIDEFSMLEYDVAFLKGDVSEMQQVLTRVRGGPGAENWISNKQASVLAYAGRLQRARGMSRLAVDQALEALQRERAGQWEAGAALREAFFGYRSEARRRAMAALQFSKNRQVEYGAAFALALSGDSTSSAALANDLEKRFPDDLIVRFEYVPVIRAQVARNHGDVSKAFEILQASVPYELGVTRANFGALYPIYVRGEAYLAAHNGAEAAAEFQKILAHRGIVVSDPVGAVARLQLARALVLSGDKVKAKIAYGDFIMLWKDADPDIPILTEAQAEYASLR
jgi:tetratricopeptide (TPR) repeat protein